MWHFKMAKIPKTNCFLVNEASTSKDCSENYFDKSLHFKIRVPVTEGFAELPNI